MSIELHPRGFCLPSGDPAHRATDNLLKRTFEYYFRKRVKVNFVFSPVALQRVKIYGTTGWSIWLYFRLG